MIAVYDGSDQVLPRVSSWRKYVGNHRTGVSSWSAHLACDADLRTRATPYRELAARLTVQEVPRG